MFEIIKGIILSFGKKWLRDWLFKKILGGAIGGIKGWLLGFAFDYLWKKLMKPASQWVSRKINTLLKRIQYKKKAKAVTDAKTPDNWDSAVDDMP